MLEYKAQNFSDIYNSELGKELWEFLNLSESKLKMETASELGKPAIDGISKSLISKFSNNLNDLRVRQMIGHMIRQIMEDIGYMLDSTNVKTKSNSVFHKASRYKKIGD